MGEADSINLPIPRVRSVSSIEEALRSRRSVRQFAGSRIQPEEISQLLWAAQGISEQQSGRRTVPSAGALYPLEAYLVAGSVERFEAGLYRYVPEVHRLIRLSGMDLRGDLARAALGQEWIGESAAIIILTAIPERTTRKYGERGIRYIHMESGAAAQNIYLQATALGLGTVLVGAFRDDAVKRVLNLKETEIPLCIMPVGRFVP